MLWLLVGIILTAVLIFWQDISNLGPRRQQPQFSNSNEQNTSIGAVCPGPRQQRSETQCEEASPTSNPRPRRNDSEMIKPTNNGPASSDSTHGVKREKLRNLQKDRSVLKPKAQSSVSSESHGEGTTSSMTDQKNQSRISELLAYQGEKISSHTTSASVSDDSGQFVIKPKAQKSFSSKSQGEGTTSSITDQNKTMAAEVKRNILLMGKTGDGKSATGNTLLGRKCFKASAYDTSVTKDVNFNFAVFDHYSLLVVDGPGFVNTELNQTDKDGNKDIARASAQAEAQRAKELELVAKNMEQSLAMCYGGVDAFLLVIKFGSRFTEEYIKTVESLKTIFGPKYLDHVVVIMTGGDLFQGAMEEEGKNCSFHDWCQNRTGELRGLYEQCRWRFVLFNNKTKDPQENRRQILELMRIVNGIVDHGSRYDADFFKQADLERQKLIVKLKAPHLKFCIQEKACLLIWEMEKLNQVKDLSPSQRADIERKLNALKIEILLEDKNFGVLQDMLELVERMCQQLNNIAELKRLEKGLEKKSWRPNLFTVGRALLQPWLHQGAAAEELHRVTLLPESAIRCTAPRRPT